MLIYSPKSLVVPLRQMDQFVHHLLQTYLRPFLPLLDSIEMIRVAPV